MLYDTHVTISRDLLAYSIAGCIAHNNNSNAINNDITHMA